MTLLPNQTAADHLTKLLSAAYESGLPVWCEISAAQASKYVLSYVQLADVLEVDHAVIHDSYSTKPAGKHWGPWYIGQLLLKRKEQAYQKRLADDAKAAAGCPIKPKIGQTPQDRAEDWAKELYSRHSGMQKNQVIRWARKQHSKRRAGKSICWWAYMVLADWKAKRDKK